MIKIRSGVGYDIHRLTPGNGLYVGGVKVSTELQAVAHSDGDVLIHALIDSLLGALGEPDIGEAFPDTDPRYRGVRSETLLAEVRQRVAAHEAEIQSVDCVVIAETPKISPFKAEIREKLSALLNMAPEDINLKAKTKEKMDSVGRGEAIECFAVSMVRLNR